MASKIFGEYKQIIEDLYGKDTFRTPFESKSDLKNSINYRCNKYIKYFESLNKSGELINYIKSNIEVLQKARHALDKSIEYYLVGKPRDAYQELAKLLDSSFYKKIIEILLINIDKYSHVKGFENQGRPHTSLYRAIVSDRGINKIGEMFHIPFQKRYLVNNQRFSIAGVPCLYLSTSIYDCWQEMGKPDLNKLYISRLKCRSNDTQYNVLDISYSIEREYEYTKKLNSIFDDEPAEETLRAKLIFWPVVMACSYQKKYPEGNFHSEYIIPHLLLQWIRSNKEHIVGIKYRSTNENKTNNSHIGDNFVFPTEPKLKKNGYCDFLSNIFEISTPISWQLINTIDMNYIKSYSTSKSHNIFRFSNNNIEDNFSSQYSMTQFYKVEEILQQIPTNQINNND